MLFVAVNGMVSEIEMGGCAFSRVFYFYFLFSLSLSPFSCRKTRWASNLPFLPQNAALPCCQQPLITAVRCLILVNHTHIISVLTTRAMRSSVERGLLHRHTAALLRTPTYTLSAARTMSSSSASSAASAAGAADTGAPVVDDGRTFDTLFEQSTPNGAGDPAKREFNYLMLGSGRMMYATAVRLGLMKFVSTMSASADVLALASLEVELDKVELGMTQTVKWRGKYCGV